MIPTRPVFHNIFYVEKPKKVIAHIDMDCFFCSVEEKYNSKLKGEAVIVGGASGRGVVSASNYVARRYGVFSAMSVVKAKQLCPFGIFLPVNMKLYQKESEKVMEVLRNFSDKVVQASVDEAYLDLTEFAKSFGGLDEMGKFIQNVVYNATKLSCSIGIAECSVTAKIASDFKKPAGCTVVDNQRKFLAPMDIKKIPGIGKKSVSNYRNKGIETIGDLAKADVFKVMDIGGKYAVRYQQIAKGEKKVKLVLRGERKSVSAEHTFNFNTRSRDKLGKVIDKMCEDIYPRIKGKYFRTVSIKLRDKDFRTITRDYSIRTMDNSLERVRKIARVLFDRAYERNYSVRLVGVKVSNFVKGGGGQSLIDWLSADLSAGRASD